MIGILYIGLVAVYPATADTRLAYQHLDEVMDRYYRGEVPRRLLASYAKTNAGELDPAISDAAFIYDNALVLLAYLHRNQAGDRARARTIAEAFVFAATHDRTYTDGRLRNAYSAKQLLNPANGKAALPGFWNHKADQWQEDRFQVSIHTGNLAWVIMALAQYYHAHGGESYRSTAIALGRWIENNTKDEAGGYRGGFEGWEPTPQTISWKSTEHNLDLTAAFTLLQRITADNTWKQRADHAGRFVASMWAGDHLWIGTNPDGQTAQTADPPLDIQAWAVLALGQYPQALSWALKSCIVQQDGFSGFDFNTDKDGIWFEGTAHMTLAFRAIHDDRKAGFYLDELRRAQSTGRGGNGKGLPAAARDSRVTTGLGWNYYAHPHIGATAWYIFAEEGFNPFYGTIIKKQ